jgi:hypothetical protein
MLNVKTLLDTSVAKGLKAAWAFRASLPQRIEDLQGWWDDTKLHIRTILKAASKLQSGKQEVRKSYITRTLETEKDWKTAEALRAELRRLEDERIDGMMLRLRINWVAARDRPTKFLLRAMAKRKPTQNIKAIK